MSDLLHCIDFSKAILYNFQVFYDQGNPVGSSALLQCPHTMSLNNMLTKISAYDTREVDLSCKVTPELINHLHCQILSHRYLKKDMLLFIKSHTSPNAFLIESQRQLTQLHVKTCSGVKIAPVRSRGRVVCLTLISAALLVAVEPVM